MTAKPMVGWLGLIDATKLLPITKVDVLLNTLSLPLQLNATDFKFLRVRRCHPL